MKTATSFTYPAFALFVLACFALSPQAFAEPTLVPSSGSFCASSKWVQVCCTTAGVNRIHVRTGSIEADVATATCPSGYTCSRCGRVQVPVPGTLTAECWVGGRKVGTATATYTKNCLNLFLIIGGVIVLIGVLIWLFKKRPSAKSQMPRY